jgi:anti-sigma B factor antagonist
MAANPPAVSATRLKLQTCTADGATVVKCSGRLTSEFAPTLKNEIKPRLTSGSRLVLDLSDLNHMDSSGLGTLVGLYVSAKTAGCNLQVVNLTPRIRELFRITNMVAVFGVCGEYGMKLP